MPQTSPNTAHKGHRHVNQCFGHAATVHQLAREDKQRHRQQGEDADLRKNLLRQDRQIAFILGQDKRDNRSTAYNVRQPQA